MHDAAMERERLSANIARLQMLREESGALIAQSHDLRARSRQECARSQQLETQIAAQAQAHVDEAQYQAELEATMVL